MSPHRERFSVYLQLYRATVTVMTVCSSACEARKDRVEDLTACVAQRQGYRRVHDLLALFDVHDVVALVTYPFE